MVTKIQDKIIQYSEKIFYTIGLVVALIILVL